MALLLVDRVGRLPLLRLSTLASTAALLALIVLSRSHIVQIHPGGFFPGYPAASRVNLMWAWLQLAILSTLAVSGPGVGGDLGCDLAAL